jgi:hypothetical protein
MSQGSQGKDATVVVTGTESAEAGQAGAAAPPSGSAGPGARPSNTAPDNYEEGNIKLLRFGVDSLYLSYNGEISEVQAKELQGRKELAQSPVPGDSAFAVAQANGHTFEVKDRAMRLFAFGLEDGCFRVDMSKGKSKLPFAYCKVASDFLASVSPEQAERDLYATLCEFGDVWPDPNVSRIDLFVDFASPVPMNGWEEDAWVTKAARVHRYTENGVFTGWGLGQGAPLLCRLYNKSVEIRISGKEYLQALWAEQGWDATVPVWRLEFQFRGEVLKQLGLGSFSRTASNLGALWAYAMGYFRLTVPNASDKNRSRWPTRRLWKALEAVDWQSNGGPLYRSFSPVRAPSREFISRQGFGAITSLMAREGIGDFYDAGEEFLDMVVAIEAERAERMGLSLDDLVDETVALKRKRYNTASLEGDVMRAAEDAETAKQAARYRKLSNGE